MTPADARELEAVIYLSQAELERNDSVDRAGALRALLSHAVPFLKLLRERGLKEVTA